MPDFQTGNLEWVSQLAGILPLSALIDFLNVQRVFHMFQLRCAIPLWCWPITPSASHFLLTAHSNIDACWLDRSQNTQAPLCLDGRYGDVYRMANPATLQMCANSAQSITVENNHSNRKKEAQRRPQQLSVILAEQVSQPLNAPRTISDLISSLSRNPKSWFQITAELSRIASQAQGYSPLEMVIVSLGWSVWVCLVILSACRSYWIALAFLIAVTVTGLIIWLIHGRKPRRLGARNRAAYVRMIISADHWNATHWTVFYGESGVMNSLINWTILPRELETNKRNPSFLLFFLRCLVGSQWGLAIGAAAKQTFDGYIIAFWILLCVASINFVFCSERSASYWLATESELKLRRYTVILSSRRALLNTLLALNPDTYADQADPNVRNPPKFRHGTLLWLDHILKAGPERDIWLEATRYAMFNGFSNIDERIENQSDELQEEHYWRPFIDEGLREAHKLKSQISIA